MSPAPVVDLAAARRRRLGLCAACGARACGALVCGDCLAWHALITRVLTRQRDRQRTRRRGRA